jgi:hypothetical protein
MEEKSQNVKNASDLANEQLKPFHDKVIELE